MTDQIQVNDSPLPDQLWAGVRQVAPAVVAFCIGKGWLGTDLAGLLGVVGGVAWPLIASQLKTRERSKLLSRLGHDPSVPGITVK